MITVYVAGPFRPSPIASVLENIRAAERVGEALARAGAMPLIPHANTGAFDGLTGIPDQFWLDGTMELMRRCDAVVLTPDWQRSSGARAEVAEAQKLLLPIHTYGVADHDPDGGENDPLKGYRWPTTVKFEGQIDDSEEYEARARLVDFLTSMAPGSAQRSRYVGDKLRAFTASARRARSTLIEGRMIGEDSATLTLILNPRPKARPHPDSAG